MGDSCHTIVIRQEEFLLLLDKELQARTLSMRSHQAFKNYNVVFVPMANPVFLIHYKGDDSMAVDSRFTVTE